MKIPTRGPQTGSPGPSSGKAATTWLNIRAEVMSRISNGTYAPGALIPTEQDLAAQFGCARATVNRALTSLAGRGVLERRRRIGTRVAQGMGGGPGKVAVPVIRHLAEDRGYQFRFTLLPPAPLAPAAACERLFRSAPENLRELCTLFHADDVLFCAERRWVDLAALPELTPERLHGTTANEAIAANPDLTLIEQSMRACTAGDADADGLLGCPPDAPVLVYDTCLWKGPAPVSWARLAFAPGFELSQNSGGPGLSLLSAALPA